SLQPSRRAWLARRHHSGEVVSRVEEGEEDCDGHLLALGDEGQARRETAVDDARPGPSPAGRSALPGRPSPARSRAVPHRRQSIVLARRGRCIRRNREEVEGTTRWSGCSIRVAVWLLEIPPVWANSRCDLDAAAWASNGRGLVQLAGVDQAHEQVADAGPV